MTGSLCDELWCVPKLHVAKCSPVVALTPKSSEVLYHHHGSTQFNEIFRETRVKYHAANANSPVFEPAAHAGFGTCIEKQ